MNQWASFGNRARFAIEVRWIDDEEPRELRPSHGGWSTGELRLTVGHHTLTRNELFGEQSDTIKWYLLPVFEWLAKNWVSLLHEERFAWHENSAAPAATAAFLALRRSIEDESSDDLHFDNVRAWWRRHSLRAADPSALYPDIVFRRLRDEVEISWTGRQPIHAPDRFRFNLTPGAATLSIAEVAQPLWEALNWVAPSGRGRLSTEADRKTLGMLEKRISSLKHLPSSQLEASYLPPKLFADVIATRDAIHLGRKAIRVKGIPALSKLDDAVLMFGGVSPDIGARDVQALLGFLAANADGHESLDLRALVDETVGAPLSAPFQEGYDLAQQLLDACSLPGDADLVDIRSFLKTLKIKVSERVLKTSTIRGVAIAGSGYSPAIIINKTSDYNATESGKRFTLAHELFHLLYDRTHARRITHVSGPWAPPGIEKRANAFAAMFLMPRSLLSHHFPQNTFEESTLGTAATSMQVGMSALVEHLYNMSMIDELTRDKLRVFSAISDKTTLS